MRVDITFVGGLRRSCEVFLDRQYHVTSGYWLDDESDLTEGELDLVHEMLIDSPDIEQVKAETAAAAAYDRWKESRWDK